MPTTRGPRNKVGVTTGGTAGNRGVSSVIDPATNQVAKLRAVWGGVATANTADGNCTRWGVLGRNP
ncbi:MAG TPA: hypothetical protein VK171_03215 [Fimbriimonas sp.]|nr:hypothetical protein [Fimbriimonas sp.]